MKMKTEIQEKINRLNLDIMQLIGIYKGQAIHNKIIKTCDSGNNLREASIIAEYEKCYILGNILKIQSIDGNNFGVAIEETEGGNVKVGDIIC